MKKLILISITIFTLYSCGSYETVTYSEEENFVKVYDDLDKSKDQLYIKANDWMITSFKDATSVIQYSDKEEGTIIGKYLMAGEMKYGSYGAKVDTRVYAKIDVRVKDSKARISIQPLGAWKYDKSGMTVYKYSKEQANLDMNELAMSLLYELKSEQVKF